MRQSVSFCALAAALAVILSPCPAVSAETVSLAAAADLVFCLDELVPAFEKSRPGVKVQTTAGSSGNFFAQIQHGAPFDVFLSADLSYPRQLIDAGLAEKENLILYGVGRIVLWTIRDDLDPARGLALLVDGNVRKIAIANPDHAPYGRAAKAALEHEKLWESVRPKLVLGENIAQTVEFVESGNADVGIVALSLVVSPKLAGKGRHFEIPESDYPPLEQAAVLTTRAKGNAAATAFLQFLGSSDARPILDRYGFRPATGSAVSK